MRRIINQVGILTIKNLEFNTIKMLEFNKHNLELNHENENFAQPFIFDTETIGISGYIIGIKHQILEY